GRSRLAVPVAAHGERPDFGRGRPGDRGGAPGGRLNLDARAQLTAIVLSDHAPDASLRTALAAREYATRVLVAERDPGSAAAARTLPADVSVVACDWSNDAAAVSLLADVATPWALFLSPGEGLACDDPDALAREIASLAPAAVELSTGSRAETRLHPPVADAL